MRFDVNVEGREPIQRRGRRGAVGYVERKRRGEVLAAVVLELHLASIYVGLRERAKHTQSGAVEQHLAVVGQGEEAVGQLVGRDGGVGAGGRKLGGTEREGLCLGDLAGVDIQAATDRVNLRHRDGRARARAGGQAFVFNLEGMNRDWRVSVVGCVDATVALVGYQPAVAVFDGEFEIGRLVGTTGGNKADSPSVDISLGEAEPDRQRLAWVGGVGEVPSGGDSRQRIGQALWRRLDIDHLQHGRRDRKHRRQVGCAREGAKGNGAKFVAAVGLGAGIP